MIEQNGEVSGEKVSESGSESTRETSSATASKTVNETNRKNSVVLSQTGTHPTPAPFQGGRVICI